MSCQHCATRTRLLELRARQLEELRGDLREWQERAETRAKWCDEVLEEYDRLDELHEELSAEHQGLRDAHAATIERRRRVEEDLEDCRRRLRRGKGPRPADQAAADAADADAAAREERAGDELADDAPWEAMESAAAVEWVLEQVWQWSAPWRGPAGELPSHVRRLVRGIEQLGYHIEDLERQLAERAGDELADAIESSTPVGIAWVIEQVEHLRALLVVGLADHAQAHGLGLLGKVERAIVELGDHTQELERRLDGAIPRDRHEQLLAAVDRQYQAERDEREALIGRLREALHRQEVDRQELCDLREQLKQTDAAHEDVLAEHAAEAERAREVERQNRDLLMRLRHDQSLVSEQVGELRRLRAQASDSETERRQLRAQLEAERARCDQLRERLGELGDHGLFGRPTPADLLTPRMVWHLLAMAEVVDLEDRVAPDGLSIATIAATWTEAERQQAAAWAVCQMADGRHGMPYRDAPDVLRPYLVRP